MAVPNIRSLDFSLLQRAGIQAIAFDKDNCLTRPYESYLYPPFQDAWDRCRDTFSPQRMVIVSNSAGTPDDHGHRQAQAVEAHLRIPVLRHRLKKPACGHDLQAYWPDIPLHRIAFVGDRLATDVMFGNLHGMLTVWTQQVISTERDNPMAVRLRYLEHHIDRRLRHYRVQPPPHPLAAAIAKARQ
ncbi:hypothetical protein H4R35_000606 [Dimargaris xerosporica]|nr:hypothetical protein H4R35_000606 [Dimargaris xerosporica]